MNHHHAQYFVDAVRLGSVARAAEKNHVTHPAISQAIRTLEGELQVQLLTHQKRRFQLTPEGQYFYKQAEIWLNQLQNTKNVLKNENKNLTGELRAIGPQSITSRYIGSALFKMRREHPHLHLQYSFGDAATVRGAVLSGRCDLGLLIDDEQLQKFSQLHLSEGHFLLVSRNPNADLWKDSLIITNSRKPEVKKLFAALLKKYKKQPRVFLELVSWSLIRKFTLQEDIIGYVPDYVVQKDIEKGRLFKIKLTVPYPTYSIKAIWRKNTALNRPSQVLLDEIRAATDLP